MRLYRQNLTGTSPTQLAVEGRSIEKARAEAERFSIPVTRATVDLHS